MQLVMMAVSYLFNFPCTTLPFVLDAIGETMGIFWVHLMGR